MAGTITSQERLQKLQIQQKCIMAKLFSKSIMREEVREKDMIIKSN